MSRLSSVLFSLALFTMSTVFWSGELFAQEVGKTKVLGPGRVQKNLGEFPSNVPGYDRVRIVEITAQPGVTWKGSGKPMRAVMFCTTLSGEVTRVRPDGKKRIRKKGDSWVCKGGRKTRAGTEHKVTSKEPWVMRMHWLLKAGDK